MKAAEFLSEYDIDFTKSLDQKGLGSVYTATAHNSGKLYALKIIELHPMFDKGETLERFRSAAALSHPALLPYLELLRFPGEDTIQHFILMPYIKEGTLADSLEELGFEEKSNMLQKTLEGLEYLHANATVWQSLRSDHILLDHEGPAIQPKFINYGAKQPLNKAFFSNYEYLAPEQLSDAPDAYFGPATDIWAFAVLAFEVYTGMLPFGRKSVQTPNRKIMERILKGETADLFEKIPEVYADIIKNCLVQKPEDRWTASAILKYLNEHELIKPKQKARAVGMLETLEKMGEDYVPEEIPEDKLPIFQRKFKRKPSKPIQWWEPFLWILMATLVGYLLSKL